MLPATNRYFRLDPGLQPRRRRVSGGHASGEYIQESALVLAMRSGKTASALRRYSVRHSCLSATMGSTCIARRAGKYDANSATPIAPSTLIV